MLLEQMSEFQQRRPESIDVLRTELFTWRFEL